jgi:hypothetical protein
MIKLLTKYGFFFLLLILGASAFAQATFSSTPLVSGALGGVANNMREPIDAARYVFNAGSYILGAGFLVGGFFRFMRFRQNPQEAPLGSVFALLVIGIILVALPLSYQLTHHFSVQGGMTDVITHG